MAIRELAVLLRNALSQKTQDAHKEVYCWQVGAGLGAPVSKAHDVVCDQLKGAHACLGDCWLPRSDLK